MLDTLDVNLYLSILPKLWMQLSLIYVKPISNKIENIQNQAQTYIELGLNIILILIYSILVLLLFIFEYLLIYWIFCVYEANVRGLFDYVKNENSMFKILQFL